MPDYHYGITQSAPKCFGVGGRYCVRRFLIYNLNGSVGGRTMRKATIALLAGLLLLGGIPFVTAMAHADGNSERPTASDFGTLPFINSPRISPDGNKFVARGRCGGLPCLILGTIGAGAPPVQPYPLPAKFNLEWYRWAGPHQILFSISQTVTDRDNQDVRLTRMIALDTRNLAAKFIGVKSQGNDGDDVIYVDPAGSFILQNTQATIYDYPSVFRIDLATGSAKEVTPAREQVWDWFADSAGVVRGGVGYAGDNWWMYYRSDGTLPFRKILKGKIGEGDVQRFVPIAGSDQGFAMAQSPEGRWALFNYDFKTDSLGAMVYSNPRYDIDDFDTDAKGALLSVSYIDDRQQTEWFDPTLKSVQARLNKALPGQLNRIISMTTDRNRMIVASGSADNPGTLYVFDQSLKQLAAFAYPFEKLVGKPLAAMQTVSYTARDGLQIPAYLTLPVGKQSATGQPLVIMPHGGPFARDSWGFDPWVQFLASKGYVVLQPNFRGSTGFGRDYVKKGTGAWGRGMQDDIDDGVKWLIDKGVVDAKRVCIMGASFGGYAAMWAATRNPEIYRCAISFAGISDVASMLRYDRGTFSAQRYFRDWRERVQGDKTVSMDTVSPLKLADKITVPLLIAHGADDDNVPPYQSRRLHDALLKLGRAHEFVIYKDEGHGLENPVHATDFLQRVGAFLDKHNPA